MIRSLLLITCIAFACSSQSQNLDTKVALAVQTVYNQYKLFFDSSLLDKYVVLNKRKSYLVNSVTQKIKTLAIADETFTFDEFSFSFAIIYKGDTIRHLPVCRLDTRQTLMALGTPTNPIRHGDILPPYVELVNGNIAFDYKKLKKLLHKMKLETTEINLQKQGDKQYVWLITTSCPELKCRQLTISAADGKILEDKNP